MNGENIKGFKLKAVGFPDASIAARNKSISLSCDYEDHCEDMLTSAGHKDYRVFIISQGTLQWIFVLLHILVNPFSVF